MDRLAARTMNEGLYKQTVLVEAIGALETVKTSGAGGLLGNRWRRAITQHSDSSLRQRLISTIAITVSTSANSIRSEEHTSELQSLMRISYAIFCLKKNKNNT